MKVKVTLITQNNSPLESLGEDPVATITRGWDLLCRMVELNSRNGDKATVEAVEIMED